MCEGRGGVGGSASVLTLRDFHSTIIVLIVCTMDETQR